MIGRLWGIVAEVGEEEALIDVAGVGYVVRCGSRTLARLPGTGETATLQIESQWGEQTGMTLYGFMDRNERRAFEMLKTIQGVGPKAALSVLDVLPPPELQAAASRGDQAAVSRAQGVGPKLALRIVTELKAKPISATVGGAAQRGEGLDHVLVFGPPGLGKTTLAQIVARELGVNFRATSGPVLAKAGDLAAILTNLEPNDVLFIDEIHRLPANVEEILYPAMEDHVLDLMIGEGPSARSIRIDLAPFTLVAATTRAGLLATPLRDRFGIPIRLEVYTPAEVQKVLAQAAGKIGVHLHPEGAAEIAARARGTPRAAGRLLLRVRDFAASDGVPLIDPSAAASALARPHVDEMGLHP